MRGQEIATRTSTSLSPILLEFHHSSPTLCKNYKNPDVDKKIQAYARHLHSPGALYFPRVDAQNSQYLVY